MSESSAITSRRRFLAGTGAFAAASTFASLGFGEESWPLTPDGYDAPVAWRGVAETLSRRLPIHKLEFVQVAGKPWLRATSRDGDVGGAFVNSRLLDTLTLAGRRILPAFVGEDVGELPALVDRVYRQPRSNYKFAGLPFWNAVAHVEIAVLDLVGRKLGRRGAELIGEPLRERVPVYITRLTRETTPEEEVDAVQAALEQTGARACKLKIGGRMQNRPQDVERTNRLVPLARRKLGDAVEIFVDANSSYTAEEAIEVGRMLEQHRVGFFEEPCPWEAYGQTQRVTETLDLPIAGGEQDSSLNVWRRMTRERGFDLCQPDVFYCGGLFRSLRIGRWAAESGLRVTPHSPKAGWKQNVMLTLAAVTPNLGPFQECVADADTSDGERSVPTSHGFGWPCTDQQLRDAPKL